MSLTYPNSPVYPVRANTEIVLAVFRLIIELSGEAQPDAVSGTEKIS